jgi:excisionase family DNA binding protein
MSLGDGRPTPDDLFRIESKLDAVLAHLAAHPATQDRRWMTIAAAARYSDLSEVSVRRLIAARRLTAHRPIKGRVLVDRKEVDALITSATKHPRSGRGRRRVAEIASPH